MRSSRVKNQQKEASASGNNASILSINAPVRNGEATDSGFTNVLRRDNAISFDVLLNSTTVSRKAIGGRKKRSTKIPSAMNGGSNRKMATR